MRAIHPTLQAKLDSGATTLCRCWLVTRLDGVTLGFTDHDRNLSFDGHDFSADSGMDASALESSTGLSVDNAQAVGALNSDGITEADIRAGRYDNAKVQNWIVDWTDTSLNVLLFSGTLGEITRSDQFFEVELRGLSEQLNNSVGRSFNSACDRILGDAKCRFDTGLPGYSVNCAVTSVLHRRRLIVSGVGGIATDWFANGRLNWIDGDNSGLTSEIKFDKVVGADREIELWREVPLAITPGDTVNLVAGCDKSPAMCRQKFQNFLNFRGFPHIPGEDWAQAYPSTGGRNDGTSLQS